MFEGPIKYKNITWILQKSTSVKIMRQNVKYVNMVNDCTTSDMN